LNTIDLQIFFKKENISPVNQNIILDYLTTIKLDGRSEATIKNNTVIMMFIATRVRSDLDKMTRADIKQLRLAIETWTRKDGKAVSDATKQQYKIGLKRFLTKYGAENGIIEMIELAKPIKSTGKAKRKLPEDLLTLDEVKQLVTAANNIRDKALIATMYESGGRIGEHVSCRVKDIVWNEYGCTLTFPKGKTGARKIQLVFAASYLRQWLEIHPLVENRDAALWVSLKGYGDKSEHIALIGRAVSEMLSRTAERAGIEKRIYPHLFRHSRATDLAKTWTESQLKNFLGWQPNSNMTATYVHLSGRDMQDSVLELYGLRAKRDEHCLEIGKCPRCKTIVNADAKYCDKCGMPLAKDAQQTNDTVMKEIAAFINSEPQLISKLMALVQAQK